MSERWDPRGKRRRPAPPRRPGRPGSRDAGPPRFRGAATTDGPVILYGWHTVKEALENPERKIRKLWVTENSARRIADENVPMPKQHEIVRPDVIAARLGPEAVHQGLLAEADPLPSPDIEEVKPEGIVLVLDQITDPHNVGAILRSAAAFAVTALVTTARHSPEATGVLAKAASGALEHVPIVVVPNLARGLTALREQGFQLVGLDSSGESDLAVTLIRGPVALVLGAEGKGLRQLTRATCDVVARLDLPGAITSLNVSNAAVLSLYVAMTQLRGTNENGGP